MPESPAAVLFDFDGTLADTAPDLGGALNRMRKARHLAPLAIQTLRPFASGGARGLLQAGFGLSPADPEYGAMREEFLALYGERPCAQTVLFPEMAELLEGLERRRVAWGIVTNKPERFTVHIVSALGLGARAACVVSGDSTPHSKPHPAPLFEAARRLSLPPSQCWYVGDDLRDVQAARAAGMRAIAVEYGYLGTGNGGPHAWNADQVIARPLELLENF